MTEKKTARVFLKGHITVPGDRLEQVRAALPAHIALTRAEPGCHLFEVTGDPVHPGRFNVSEVFEDQAAFDAHQQRTQASDWFRITQGLPRSYKMTTE